MSFLADLARTLSTEHPDWAVDLDAEGPVLVVSPPGPTEDRLQLLLREEEDAVVLEDLWRIPLRDGNEPEARSLLLQVLRDGAENCGWEVPVLLQGGPCAGRRLTRPWEDLIGRLVLARPTDRDGAPHEAHVYKWHLKKGDAGDYVCVYERTLRAEEADRFIARGVESTGPFVVIRDA